MKTLNTTLDFLGEWMENPHITLREYPNGTLFLMHHANGATHLYELAGNIESDQSWKAKRLSDFSYIRLERQRGALVFLLNNSVEYILSHD